MRRLSIVDLAGGHQPMSSPDGRFTIVFNGEVYNHLDVREEIGGRYSFRTHCDTETILAAYVLWKDEAWRRLEGMFAVAIWDRAERSLRLVRDPLGIKPLYISEQRGGISFGSELKAIQLLPDHRFSVDDNAVGDYFSFGHVRRPRSIYKEVVTLDPGSILTFDREGKRETMRYWQARFRPGPAKRDAEWIEQTASMVKSTCRRHMMADVPVAAFLSGGIDSSAVLAAMRDSSDSEITAFTVSHPGHSIDEADAAAQVARHLGCAHRVMPLEANEALSTLPKIAATFDEPFADMAAIPTWFLSKFAAEEVKVVLCGEGGDELFFGYKRHRNADLMGRHPRLVSALKPLAGLISQKSLSGSHNFNRFAQYAERFGEFAGATAGRDQFLLATRLSSKNLHDRVVSSKVGRSSTNDEDHFLQKQSGARSGLEEFVYADLTLNLPSDMLTRLDRASMAHSLEARVPFLSHRLVDWALSIPTGLKIRRGVGKYILRQAAKPWLPEKILKLPKQGFQIPMASWLRSGAFADRALGIWVDSGAEAAGYLDGREVRNLFGEHRAGDRDHARFLYAILMFAMWWSNSKDRQSIA